MRKSFIRCPACNRKVDAASGQNGRYWCTKCDEVFETDDLPFAAEADEPEPRDAGAGGSRGLLAALAAVSVLCVAALGAAAYFALKKDEPKEAAATAPPPPAPAPVPKPEPPRPPVTEPKKPEPKKPEPKPPTAEEVVRRVKQATVYIRTTLGPGEVDMGSGFFAGPPGFVVTNAHVVGYGPREVRRPEKVEVVIAGGEANERTLPARVHGVDVLDDLAVLRVEGQNLPAPLPFGRAAGLVETQEVVVYGYPFGELLGKNISVNRSSVSSLRKENGKLVIVQLAGGLNPGNSGGPVTNAKGEVVGVSVAKLRGAETIAFAIPAEEADSFVKDQHRAGGRFELGGLVAAAPIPRRTPVRPPVRPPVKPPINPAVKPPGNPAGVGPLRPVVALEKSDRVYVPKGDAEQAKLPGRVADVATGGGGRFLIFRLTDQKKLAVFDVWLAKVVKEIPLAEETKHIAAGANRLVIVYRGAKLIQYWNLTTFEKERSALLPDALTGDDINQICMGSASDGPLFVQLPKEKRTFAVDLGNLKATEVRWSHWASWNAYGPHEMRASPDGSLLIGRGGGWVGCEIATFENGKQTGSFPKVEFCDLGNCFALPSADSRFVFTPWATVNRSFTATKSELKAWAAVPSVEPGFMIAVLGVGEVGRPLREGQAPKDFVVYNEDRQKLFLLKGLDEVAADSLAWERKIFYYPKSGLLLTLDGTENRLILRRVNLTEELDRSGADYLAVVSRPPAVVAGNPFEYQIEAKSKKGGVKYKLEAGPEGLTVGADGKVTWAEPRGLDKSVNVVIAVSDKSGQEVIHSFELGTVIPKGGR